MLWTIFGAATIATVIIVITYLLVEFGIPRAIIAIANVDSWWSPVRTLPPPGEMYILVRGDPNGPFDTVIESVLGYRYDKTKHIFVKEKKKKNQASPPETYLSKLGVEWVWFWKYFLWRKVSYDKWEMTRDDQGKPTGTLGLVPKVRGDKKAEDDSPSIFFRYNMATEVREAETVGNFPVNAVLVFTIQIENPAQAFFFAGGWEAQTAAAVQGVFREYVGKMTIEKLREEVQDNSGALIDKIKNLTGGTGKHDGLLELFGIRIIDVRFVSFDLVGGDDAMRNAVRAKEVEKLQADAAEERGKGEKRERTERAEGIRVEVAAWGSHPVGATLAMAEAVKVARPQAIGAGILASVEIPPRREST